MRHPTSYIPVSDVTGLDRPAHLVRMIVEGGDDALAVMRRYEAEIIARTLRACGVSPLVGKGVLSGVLNLDDLMNQRAVEEASVANDFLTGNQPPGEALA